MIFLLSLIFASQNQKRECKEVSCIKLHINRFQLDLLNVNIFYETIPDIATVVFDNRISPTHYKSSAGYDMSGKRSLTGLKMLVCNLESDKDSHLLDIKTISTWNSYYREFWAFTGYNRVSLLSTIEKEKRTTSVNPGSDSDSSEEEGEEVYENHIKSNARLFLRDLEDKVFKVISAVMKVNWNYEKNRSALSSISALSRSKSLGMCEDAIRTEFYCCFDDKYYPYANFKRRFLSRIQAIDTFLRTQVTRFCTMHLSVEEDTIKTKDKTILEAEEFLRKDLVSYCLNYKYKSFIEFLEYIREHLDNQLNYYKARSKCENTQIVKSSFIERYQVMVEDLEKMVPYWIEDFLERCVEELNESKIIKNNFDYVENKRGISRIDFIHYCFITDVGNALAGTSLANFDEKYHDYFVTNGSTKVIPEDYLMFIFYFKGESKQLNYTFAFNNNFKVHDVKNNLLNSEYVISNRGDFAHLFVNKKDIRKYDVKMLTIQYQMNGKGWYTISFDTKNES